MIISCFLARWLAMFLREKVLQGVLCIVLHLTPIGWIRRPFGPLSRRGARALPDAHRTGGRHYEVTSESEGKSAALLTLGTELAMLGVEAQMVIGQRLALFMLGGPKARKEARLMVTEKVKAASEAAVTIALGGTPRKVVGATGARSR